MQQLLAITFTRRAKAVALLSLYLVYYIAGLVRLFLEFG